MKVYVVFDTNDNKIVSVHKTMTGARKALVDYLETQTSMSYGFWENSACDNGYDTVSDFMDAMLTMDDYDSDIDMYVKVCDLFD